MFAQTRIAHLSFHWHLPMPALASSFSISVLVHVVLLTGGMFWAGAASRQFTGPSEFELVGLEAAFESGVNAQERKAASQGAKKASPVDEALVGDRLKATKSETAAVAQKASRGSAGASIANVGTTADRWQIYGASVRQSILDRFRYPTASRTLGETGRVKVAFAVLADGSLTEVRLKVPSAFERLNDAAVLMVANVERVGPLPETGLSKWDTEIAIDFKLN
jgi:TonB family protein